jgi:hypothetical protein
MTKKKLLCPTCERKHEKIIEVECKICKNTTCSLSTIKCRKCGFDVCQKCIVLTMPNILVCDTCFIRYNYIKVTSITFS